MEKDQEQCCVSEFGQEIHSDIHVFKFENAHTCTCTLGLLLPQKCTVYAVLCTDSMRDANLAAFEGGPSITVP